MLLYVNEKQTPLTPTQKCLLSLKEQIVSIPDYFLKYFGGMIGIQPKI